MKATEILMSEHRVIERVIASLETAAQELSGGKNIRPEFFVQATDFVRGFADGCHHKKEEGVLFKALTANGLPEDEGPVGMMLLEHEQGRVYIRGLRAAALELASGNQAARADVVKNALGYGQLLRQHIQKEDKVLFPMADQIIPVAGHDAVIDGFEHVEHEETGAGVHEKYLALAEALEKEIA